MNGPGRLRVATVLSAREWEPDLVAAARESAMVRLVLRAYQPEDVERMADDLDVIVAGAETSWITPGILAGWRRRGLRIVGVHPAGDHPARDLLITGGADEVMADDASTEAILHAIRLQQPIADQPSPPKRGTTVVVTGAAGAPGRTEVALALAWNWARNRRVLLVDLDVANPALAIRLGLPPRPDVITVSEHVRRDGRLGPDAARRFGPLRVLVGSHRPGEPPLRQTLAEDVIGAAAADFDAIVIDTGPPTPEVNDRIVKLADEAVLVVDAAAVGIVRAAGIATEWSGPAPALVVNRAERAAAADVTLAVRRWTGLDPAAFIPDQRRIRRSALASRPPDRAITRPLRRLRVPA